MPQAPTLDLFGFSLLNTTTVQALDTLFASGAGARTAAFLNAHCINVSRSDASYRWALRKADVLLPDGSGMQMAAKMSGSRFVENLNGTDLFLPLCRRAADQNMPVFFFGSQPGVAESASKRASELVEGFTVAGTRHGFFNPDEEDDIIDAINASGAEVVLVALGVPLQDIWIARSRHRLNARLVLGVGAQFDFWSGRVPRAPALFRRFGLEWVFRLCIEPRRMANRYLVGNIRFLVHAYARRRSHRPADISDRLALRLFDLAISGAAITVLSPVMLAIAAAIRLESPGPVLFRQTRIGKDGAPFTVLKFRSMYRDAEARRSALLASSDRDGICFKAKHDPRVTRVGRILRRLSLDELPQLFNVLSGKMAIVGPRPALPEEVSAYPNNALDRLAGKPGITGLWQVSGRAEIGFDKMVDMDRAYIASRSVFLDIAILFLTIRAVVTGRGAY